MAMAMMGRAMAFLHFDASLTPSRPCLFKPNAQFIRPLLQSCRTRTRDCPLASKGGVEPDLIEDDYDIYATAGEDLEFLFPYGKADGHHAWHEGDDVGFVEGILEVFRESGGPTGVQGAISWLFLPGLIAGLVYHIEGEYLMIYTGLFIFAFIGMQMAKQLNEESNALPEVYAKKDE